MCSLAFFSCSYAFILASSCAWAILLSRSFYFFTCSILVRTSSTDCWTNSFSLLTILALAIWSPAFLILSVYFSLYSIVKPLPFCSSISRSKTSLRASSSYTSWTSDGEPLVTTTRVAEDGVLAKSSLRKVYFKLMSWLVIASLISGKFSRQSGSLAWFMSNI